MCALIASSTGLGVTLLHITGKGEGIIAIMLGLFTTALTMHILEIEK